MEAKLFLEQFQDFLAPTLDTYEQAIYLYIFRNSRLIGKNEITIGFKSARKKIAQGSGIAGQPMSENSCYKKLQSLEKKGCLKILGTEWSGTRVALLLPTEIPSMIPSAAELVQQDIETMDFFNVPENRLLIFEREGNKCFYCFRNLTEANRLIEHVVSRPEGNNSYQNLVAACKNCNDKKNDVPAEDFFRQLYRSGALNDKELADRLEVLGALQKGELKPQQKSR